MFAFQTRQAALTIAIIVTSSATLTAQRRTWTDSSGKFSVEAEIGGRKARQRRAQDGGREEHYHTDLAAEQVGS